MAAKSTIAKRYARAYADALKGASMSHLEEFEIFVASISKDTKLASFLKSPAFKVDEKWGVVLEILSKSGASKDLSQFIRVLLESGRIFLIDEVWTEFKRVMLERSGEVEAIVETAYALTDTELKLVKANLEKSIAKKLRLSVELKPELVAGLKIRVDGKTLDGTLAAHLNRLQKQLVQAEA
jgi:F-type H+-transporting ATPase subunit delta